MGDGVGGAVGDEVKATVGDPVGAGVGYAVDLIGAGVGESVSGGALLVVVVAAAVVVTGASVVIGCESASGGIPPLFVQYVCPGVVKSLQQ